MEVLEEKVLLSVSLDAQGWTVIGPSADTRVIYVSDSEGSDQNDGLSEATPKKTIAAGKAILRNGYPDWLLLKKGDTWTDQQFGYNNLHGRSEQERMVFGAYGTGARPLLKTAHATPGFANTKTATPATNLAFIGLEFLAYTREPHTPDWEGPPQATDCFTFLYSIQNILIEDVKAQYYEIGIVAQDDFFGSDNNLEIRRSVFANQYHIGAGGAGGYFYGMDGLLIEDSVWDHNGWYGDRDNGGVYIGVYFTRGTYTHSTRQLTNSGEFADYSWQSGDKIYISSGSIPPGEYVIESQVNDDTIVLAVDARLTGNSSGDVNSIESRAKAEHNFYISNQQHAAVSTRDERPHIIVRNNIIARTASTSNTMRAGGTMQNNLVIGGATGTDHGYSHDTHEHPDGVDSYIGHNVFINGELANSATNFSWAIRTMNARTSVIEDNIILHKTTDSTVNVYAFELNGSRSRDDDITLSRNIVYDYTKGAPYCGSSCQYLDVTENNNSYWDASGAGWTVSGTNRNSEDLAFVDPTRDIGTYNATLGGEATVEAFLTEAKLQSKDNWRNQYTATVVNDYIRAGFVIADEATDKIGSYRDSTWLLDANGNDGWDKESGGDSTLGFGTDGDTPVVGDWNGDGVDDIGVRRGAQWFLDGNGNGIWDRSEGGDILFGFGALGDTPVVGDWNGDGVDDVGVHRGSQWFLDGNGNGNWDGTVGGDFFFNFGAIDDTPIIGDWNGDGTSDIGVHRGNQWLLDVNSDHDWDDVDGGDSRHGFGAIGDTPIIGDWNGDGRDDLGVHRGSQWLLDANGNHSWDGVTGGDSMFSYGAVTDTPLAGNWITPSPLLATEQATTLADGTYDITHEVLDSVVDDARGLWVAAGLETHFIDKLEDVDLRITDLSGSYLGLASESRITIDQDAAGHGWFIDPTSSRNEEFSRAGDGSFLALPDGPADGRIDLLSVVMHEMGHILGLNDLRAPVDSNNIMNDILSPGVRREFSPSVVDAVLAQD
jgi:hypothetical protein